MYIAVVGLIPVTAIAAGPALHGGTVGAVPPPPPTLTQGNTSLLKLTQVSLSETKTLLQLLRLTQEKSLDS